MEHPEKIMAPWTYVCVFRSSGHFLDFQCIPIKKMQAPVLMTPRRKVPLTHPISNVNKSAPTLKVVRDQEFASANPARNRDIPGPEKQARSNTMLVSKNFESWEEWGKRMSGHWNLFETACSVQVRRLEGRCKNPLGKLIREHQQKHNSKPRYRTHARWQAAGLSKDSPL